MWHIQLGCHTRANMPLPLMTRVERAGCLCSCMPTVCTARHLLTPTSGCAYACRTPCCSPYHSCSAITTRQTAGWLTCIGTITGSCWQGDTIAKQAGHAGHASRPAVCFLCSSARLKWLRRLQTALTAHRGQCDVGKHDVAVVNLQVVGKHPRCVAYKHVRCTVVGPPQAI